MRLAVLAAFALIAAAWPARAQEGATACYVRSTEDFPAVASAVSERCREGDVLYVEAATADPFAVAAMLCRFEKRIEIDGPAGRVICEYRGSPRVWRP